MDHAVITNGHQAGEFNLKPSKVAYRTEFIKSTHPSNIKKIKIEKIKIEKIKIDGQKRGEADFVQPTDLVDHPMSSSLEVSEIGDGSM